MPVLLGAFETSLRGGDSPHVDRKSLHKGCCGTLHGHGVAKEKAQMKTPAGRSCSLEHNESSSSGDESFITNVPDILSSSVGKRIVNGRSHSSDCAPQSPTLGPRGSHGSGANNVSKRSNSASVAQRLFTSPTLATTAKVRAERTASDSRKMTIEMKRMQNLHAYNARNTNSMHNLSHERRGRLMTAGRHDDVDHDSGHFSSDNESHLQPKRPTIRSSSTQIVDIVQECDVSSQDRKQHLIHGASDDEFLGSPSEIRHRQRMERRDYLTRVGSNGSGSDVNKPQRRRKESPSPVPKVRWGDRGRRSSDESSEVSSSNSPPITPTPRSGSGARRALSATISKKANNSGAGYAFGSSTSRFSSEDRLGSLGRRAKLYTKSHSDGMSPGHPGHHHYHYQDAHHLNRTASESRAIDKKGAKSREKKKTDITKAWMQFKDDVESALQRKPNQSGFYKNLSDMMHTKMEMLNDEAKSEEQLASERAFLEAERVWLVHKDGFAAAGLLKDDGDVPEGKVRVQLDYNGDIIEVEEDDVERANPTGFDKVEDLAQLRYLNESSALHTLRQRYGNSLIHTFAGPTIIAINPMAPLAIYSDKVIEMFKECKIEDMPPHIYTVAATAHRDMLLSRKDQSIVLMGRSGSGKTVNLKHVLHYFAVSANNPKTGVFTPDRVQAISTLLEAFGNTRTIINANATRFSSLFSIDFDPSGQIASASLQTMLLEKSRVVRRPDGEPNFNIFYQMLAGLDTQTRLELHLDNLSDPNLFMTPLSRSEDKTQAAAAWGRICTAITIMKITPQESFVLWSVLAAIYHLGVASVARGNLGKTQFAHPEAAQRAAECLGTTVDELTRSIFQGNTSSSTLNRKLRSTDKDSANLPDGIESLEAFVMGLYQDTFNTLVFLINRAISTNASAHNSILVVDAPGFQNSSTCGRYQGGTFEDLCHNYVQERLQLMFHERSISSLHDKYVQEKLDCDLDDLDELPTPAPLVALIDKQAGTRVSQSNLASADRRGLLWLLDEEALFPGATDESFVERLLLQYNQRGCEDLLKKGPTDKQFVLQHFQGTNPVLYNANGWLQASREDGAVKAASVQLQDSSLKPVSELFCASRGPGAASVSGSIAGLEGNHSLRRASSIRRGFTTGGQMGMKRHSVALQVKFQVDTLMEQLRRTKSQFVHCFIPQHNSGLCDVKGGLNITKSNGSVNSNPSEEILMNVPLVRSQLRGAQILDAVRLHKNGFPESMNYSEFWRKFRTLGHEDAMKIQPTLGEMKEAVGSLLEFIDLDKSTARLGNTQVFLRAGVLAHLQEERDEKLTDQVVRFQALCRGHLARKRFQRRKTQDIAIRCIQKNVRKFMGVRDWPWWRLLVKLTPLLNVHRTEDQLKSRTDELEMLKARLEKVEKERTEFKQANEKLENRLSEMTADLAEEHSTATLATERLEAEQAERLKLEKEKNDLTSRNKQLLHSNERMEMEVLYSRALDMNGSADSDEDGEPSIFKQKYERAIKELEFTKKRLAQQHDDDMEQLMALKKQLEKKLHDAFDEVDEQRQNVAQWKRKAQKAQGEMNDTKLLLEEQTSRNLLLEKKQRKFDAEINSLQEDRKQEKTAKDKFYRELDDIKRIKYSLEDEITAMKLDLDYKDEKISALSKELEDLHSGGTTDEEVSSLKRQKNDLEKRLKDQEEELDDMAGQVQMLEQAKIKLEMSMAALKKDHRREISSKEDELEDARNAAMKKVKALEQQLESEHEERIGFVREKHELETKIINLQDLASRSTDEDVVAKLKKDLKRTKALLKDAQYMLERSRNETSNKSLIRQLKNQLEDAEFARISAIKAKQNTDLELSDVQQQLDDVMRSKSDVEDKLFRIGREKADLATQLEDNDSELSEVMKKYKASVGQLSVDQITIHEQANAISDLEEERNQLKEQLAEFTAKVQSMEGENVSTAQHHRLELKIKELESKLDLEQTTRGRMETQINRLKEAIEKINIECDQLRGKEHSAQELVRKLQRQLRDLKEEFTNLQAKETEVNSKKNELEKMLELAEAETVTAKNDLKLAMKRIEDLQTAMNGEIDSDSDSILSDGDSDSSDDDVSNIFDRRASHLTRGSISRTLEPMPEEPESFA